MANTALKETPMENSMSGSLLDPIKDKLKLKAKYGNWIDGKYAEPAEGKYFDSVSPVTGEAYMQAARSSERDLELALDAAHRAQESWGKMAPAQRGLILNKIADRVEENIERLALAEAIDMGKPLREGMAGDLMMVIDHFRYFAAACRTDDSSVSQIDNDTMAYHYHEPIGVVGAIIPWNFPLVLTAWKVAPALAAGNSIVVKPAQQSPLSIMLFMEMIADLIPPGVINVVQGFGSEVGKALATSPRIGKLTFTGGTDTGKLIMQYASQNIVPVTLELGGKSPNVFFPDIFAADDEYADKAMEGFALFALNKGEVCTCPSRVLVHEKIYDKFMEKAIARVEKIAVGNPFELSTMMGPASSADQHKKVMEYVDIGKKEGAKLATGGTKPQFGNAMDGGYYMKPTIFEGNNSMRIFQEEIFGPVVSVTRFKDFDDAMKIANDTIFGLTAGVWTRDLNTAYRASRAIKAGRVWVNSYHLYPTHAAFGGYKQSGIGRENHRMMLSHFQQTKCVLTSYSPNALGFF